MKSHTTKFAPVAHLDVGEEFPTRLQIPVLLRPFILKFLVGGDGALDHCVTTHFCGCGGPGGCGCAVEGGCGGCGGPGGWLEDHPPQQLLLYIHCPSH